ncbi:MAG: ABC transporter ATP-binding protein [Candidatus Magasanikbacteria bacterium]|jgi:ATP-binding cassette, subfamily B, bacterial MsbA|nr:ABC transporter ATP-binding protein [Candidatus Magasanikbacteria bacterium]MBT4071557.1 ABC transporter ATP-binding protein [Candidatus Magasanikbacteria bacterium]
MIFDKEKINYFKKAFLYLKKYSKLSFLVIIFAILSSFFEGFGIGTIIPLFQWLMDPSSLDFSSIPYGEAIELFLSQYEQSTVLISLVVFIFSMNTLKNIFTYLNTIIVNKISNYIKRDLQVDLFSAITKSGLSFFQSMRSGHLIGSISIYADNVSHFIFSLLNFIIVSSRIVIYIALLLLISWHFTIFVGIVGICILPVIRLVLVRIRRIGFRIAEHVSGIHSRMSEMFTNITLMKIFGTEELETKKFAEESHNLAHNYYMGSVYSNILNPFSEIVVMGLLLLIGVFLFLYGGATQKMLVPAIIAYIYVFSRLYTQINNFIRLLSTVYAYIEPFKKYENLLKQAKNGKIIFGDKKINKFSKGIEFEHVSFAYGERTVLQNLSLSIKKGNFVAFVGATGTGKSTIAHLISGLYVVNEGKISIDGENINDIDVYDWRKHIGYVSQDIMLFNDSIKNNIAYGVSDVSSKEIVNAAKAANIHEFIRTLPEGYDTNLGERGVRLSGGQRQRIAIARALVRKPDILILDEATSSLDVKVEKQIQEELRELFKGKTIIAIAHRLSTIVDADNIFVLHNGTILESGTHEKLIKQKGFYTQLYNLQ